MFIRIMYEKKIYIYSFKKVPHAPFPPNYALTTDITKVSLQSN